MAFYVIEDHLLPSAGTSSKAKWPAMMRLEHKSMPTNSTFVNEGFTFAN
jgi:hypothetical protein